MRKQIGYKRLCEALTPQCCTGFLLSRLIRMILGALGVTALSLVYSGGRADAAAIHRKCEVFWSARDKARCACALEQGGWVTEVQGKWRWIYPRRHQERHCHGS